jgi:hypothetical protein
MAGKRFSRILSAAKYYPAIDNYIKYITEAARRGANVGNGRPRPESALAYLKPFSLDLPNTIYAQVSGNAATLTARRGATDNRVLTALATGNTGIRIDRFRAARAVIRTGMGPGTKATSKITGMPYKDYGGVSTSIPFGRNSATDTEGEAFASIRQAIQGAVSNSQVSWLKEGN